MDRGKGGIEMKNSVIPATLERIGKNKAPELAIDARKLHEAFITTTDFHPWFRKQVVERAKLKKDRDYEIRNVYGYERNKYRKKYLLTLNAAKRVARLKRNKISCVCRSIDGFLLLEVSNHKNSYETWELMDEAAYKRAKKEAERVKAERKAQREAEQETRLTTDCAAKEADDRSETNETAKFLEDALQESDRAANTGIVPFEFEGQPLRTDDDNGEIWFCANDVCACLGYSNPRKALDDHCDTSDVTKRYIGVVTGKKADGSDAIQQVATNFVNESGLYALIFGSRLPKAKMFKRWITSEVLPSIRKTGAYQTPSRESGMPSSQDLSLIAIQKLIAETLAAQAKIAALEAQQEEMSNRVKTLETKANNNGYITPFEQQKLREAVQQKNQNERCEQQ
jgi:prophage antirepressor-like protein/phage anti-repressor protein